ncbi:MAG: pantothenate synthetase [Gemmatales bacterium]|nr:MAG: pantothenate synthetase [Gemmatales bacterium]
MEVAKTVQAMRRLTNSARRQGKKIGLVPTMGALHAGHISLIRAARKETDFVVVTIFVNPTQFGPNEDLDRYPRQLEKDLEICDSEGVDAVFAPDNEEMYPKGYRTYVEVHELQNLLCGASRPGHFRGVTTVVLKLFNIVQADVAFFGQKDGQQALIIQQMVRDLNVPIEIRVCPIVREPDGLALSSRNQYLDPNQRAQATVLHRALEKARQAIEHGERDGGRIQRLLEETIRSAPDAVIDYAVVVDPETLQPLTALDGKVYLALAVRFGDTRLIDNMQVEVPTLRAGG